MKLYDIDFFFNTDSGKFYGGDLSEKAIKWLYENEPEFKSSLDALPEIIHNYQIR